MAPARWVGAELLRRCVLRFVQNWDNRHKVVAVGLQHSGCSFLLPEQAPGALLPMEP
ncbi:hypothetical protein [Ktedonobacter robiniae]|uniref:hypothetical protein n=1 Tax=Ktedonobacter robiniae TaxID=2778365 RepID=UPI001916BC56|nr:hypothetical protein [Ktedonobacter robiniae]